MRRAPLARHPTLADRQRQGRVEGLDRRVRMAEAELADRQPLHGAATRDLVDVISEGAGEAEGRFLGHKR